MTFRYAGCATRAQAGKDDRERRPDNNPLRLITSCLSAYFIGTDYFRFPTVGGAMASRLIKASSRSTPR